jgi:ABC-type ATPase involved in cell division
MNQLKIVVEGKVSTSIRAEQVSSMFDAPPEEKCRLEWELDLAPMHAEPWSIGLVVGPSGSGKTTVMRELWGEPRELEWNGAGVVDDFSEKFSVQDISHVCQAVGFNTIPAWMRPFKVLSNGEKFRVDLARRLLEANGEHPVVVDEFTSVVDRQVAQIGSHAVQKYVRRTGRKFVAVGCHYDVIEWLQPDWVLDMATRQMTRRLLRQRPAVRITVGRVPRAAWRMFAPFHYLTASLHPAAQCYGLWANGKLAVFAGVIAMPHATSRGIKRISRLVTLPDWQGMGLAMILVEKMGAAHKAAGFRLRAYPAHPALVGSFDRAQEWRLESAPKMASISLTTTLQKSGGGRPCAVFEYCGPASSKEDAEKLTGH